MNLNSITSRIPCRYTFEIDILANDDALETGGLNEMTLLNISMQNVSLLRPHTIFRECSHAINAITCMCSFHTISLSLSLSLSLYPLSSFMTRKLYALASGKCAAESADSPSNQEILLGGHFYLMVLKVSMWGSPLKFRDFPL